MGLMAFQRILLEDILDFALHIATSFKIVRSEAQLSVLNAAVYMRKKKKMFLVSMFAPALPIKLA